MYEEKTMERRLVSWRFTTEDLVKRNDLEAIATAMENVTVPHTWSVTEKYENYMGKGWYSTVFSLDEISDVVRIEFDAVYRDAYVYLNGKMAGSHISSGYTPFSVDISGLVRRGDNTLTVCVDNSFSENALPYLNHFDWACDGGIIRNVRLIEKRACDIKECRVRTFDYDFLSSSASLEIRLSLEKAESGVDAVPYSLVDSDGKLVVSGVVHVSADGTGVSSVRLSGLALWSPENPVLYTLTMECEGCSKKTSVGFRELVVRGNRFVFNGKERILRGVEWMPGDNPGCGMAEDDASMERHLEMLKDLGVEFTRFHWQQDDRVFDWCDRHGIMVQEEIPLWGSPKSVDDATAAIAELQAKEMISAHFNHPSIVSWGVGNELDGSSLETLCYVSVMYGMIKATDPGRLCSYVSNTIHRESVIDAAMLGDFATWNEYMGLWYPDMTDHRKGLMDVLEKCKGMPLVVTEVGLCEPAFPGGDEERCRLYEEREALYRDCGLAGWIYFSLNDYRTHMGEAGKGRFCMRIHWSVTVDGVKKPSYDVLRRLLHGNIE